MLLPGRARPRRAAQEADCLLGDVVKEYVLLGTVAAGHVGLPGELLAGQPEQLA
jgi:hypothetical protein